MKPHIERQRLIHSIASTWAIEWATRLEVNGKPYAYQVDLPARRVYLMNDINLEELRDASACAGKVEIQFRLLSL